MSKRFFLFFLVVTATIISLVIPETISTATTDYSIGKSQSVYNHFVYLPLVIKPKQRNLLLGVYTEGYLGQQSTIDNEVKAIENWSGKSLSFLGTFIAIEDAYPFYNIPVPLGLIWNSGYTPFVNLETTKTLAYINNGNLDTQIRNMAKAFKQWRDEGLSSGQNRKALVAPLQEMNGDWVSYHGSPNDFKTAFERIRNLFNSEGASPAVRWVFAPNGWSDPNNPQFEDYYPGDSLVEVVAFSGYNAGYCPSASWKTWEIPETVFGSYIERMRIMAPTKPIIIAQTATTAYTQSGYSQEAKNGWLTDAYAYLASYQGVLGIIYFNKQINQSCDWAFYINQGSKFTGYIEGVNRIEVTYISPEVLAGQQLLP